MSHPRESLAQLSLQQRLDIEQRLLNQSASTTPSSPPVRSSSLQPLSFAQESLWYLDHVVPGRPLYNIPQAFRLSGPLRPDALQHAFAALVLRHEALRLRLSNVEGSPRQGVRPEPFQLEIIDLTGWPSCDRENELQRLIAHEAQRPFRLTEDWLMRACLVRLQDQSHALLLTVHHIVADFASLEILHHELGILYQALLENRPPGLGEPALQFPAWAARERQAIHSHPVLQSLAYWKERLANCRPALQLPFDHPRRSAPTFAGSRRQVQLPAPLTAALRALARREGVTLFMLLLAALKTLLFRYSRQEDLLVGSPALRRDDPEAQGSIGFFLNLIVLRTDLSGNPRFNELLQRVRHVTAGAFAHAEAPLEKLVEELQLAKADGRNPLCQVVFQYLPSPWPAPKLAGISVKPLPAETGTAKFDLTWTVLEGSSGLIVDLEYSTEIFEPGTVERMLAHFEVLLASVVADPASHVAFLPLLTAAEREQLLVSWNRTATPYPRQSTIPELFEEQAALHPDSVALRQGRQTLTYEELNARANQLARFLIGRHVAPGSLAGLCLERSPDAIVGLLAILKAGAAYVPLDPKSPPDRIRQLVAKAGLRVVLTVDRLAHLFPQCDLVLLDTEGPAIAAEGGANLAVPVPATDRAYVLFTSGSTGESKGVVVPHRAVVRLVKGADYATLDRQDTFLQFAPLSFDASTFEIWGSLLNGATLVIYPADFESLEQLGAEIGRQGITTLWLTAGLFHQMIDHQIEALRHVRQLLAGGDVLSVPHVLKALRELPQCQLINGYGPTENTTFTCCYRFPRDWPGTSSAPIGRPISNTQVYLLDEQLEPVPIGVPGELCVAGDGLALGYLHSPGLTEEKFVPHPFAVAPGARLYRTGDHARFRADGNIEFLGRSDDQVKINGYRVHLSEVEACLRALPGVREAAVNAIPDSSGTRQLAAYVIPVRPDLSAAQVRTAAAEKLPGFMLPAQCVILDRLPLTSNGKVDRAALPTPSASTAVLPTAEAPAPSPVQAEVLRIWAEVFGRPALTLEDNFFDLGGHSLLATRLISRINQSFRTNISLRTLFDSPTVRAFAEQIGAAAPDASVGPIRRRA